MPVNLYFITGGGLFGLSTALEILRNDPNAHVTMISHSRPGAASDDDTKISRYDYSDLERMKGAKSGQDTMKNDEMFKDAWFPVGRWQAWTKDNLPTLDAIDECRSQLNLSKLKRCVVSVINSQYGATLAPNDLVYTYHDDILMDMKRIMNAMWKEVLRLGEGGTRVTIHEVLVKNFVHKHNRITDLVTDDRHIFDSSKAQVILAAGPWTNDILLKSEIRQPDDPRNPVATAIFSFFFQVPKDQVNFFKRKPMFSYIGQFECVFFHEGTMAKITYIKSFTHITATDGPSISCPADLTNSCLASQYCSEATKMALKYFPRLKGAKLMKTKGCFDGIPLNQQPLFAWHPDFENLFLDCGGSFNWGKQVDVGKYAWRGINRECLLKFGWESIDPSASNITNNQPLLLSDGANYNELELAAQQAGWKPLNENLVLWSDNC